MRVLIVLTSAGKAPGGGKTGFSLATFAEVYYALRDAGVEAILASPEGGAPPQHPAILSSDPLIIRLLADRDTRGALTDTLRLDQIEPGDFDAAIYPGGPGTLLDLAGDACSHAILDALSRAGKPVGLIGEGAAALFAGPLVTCPDGSGARRVANHILSLITSTESPS